MVRKWQAALLAGLIACAGCDLLPFGARRADVNGIQIAYRVHGHGSSLLLLHGGGGRSLGMARQIIDFGKRFRVIAPDSRSHGGSSDPGDTLDYHVMAEDMAALLDRLRITRADVVGWSDGGIIGLDLAIHHPELVHRLVVFGANANPEGINPERFASLNERRAEDSIEVSRGGPDPAPLDVRLRRLWLTQPHFTAEELRTIQAPTLVVVGDHDLPSLEHTLWLARAIPGAELCVIPGASHAVLRERPDLADPVVMQFLRTTGRAPRP